MKRSAIPSSHILIKASTNSDWDVVDFAIIELTESFKSALHQRLQAIKMFETDESFSNLNYWDMPLGYYCNADHVLYSEEIIPHGNDWTYIDLEKGEEENLRMPENHLEAHQLLISKDGFANFKACSKYTNEEYWTEGFLITSLLMI